MMRVGNFFLIIFAVVTGQCYVLELIKSAKGLSSEIHRNVTHTSIERIIGGNQASVGRFPYQVAIMTDYGLFCSGAIVSENYALSAAHCMNGIFYLIAYLGVHNIREPDENWVEMVIHRNACRLHPEWNTENRANDIALIEFPEAVKLNGFVNVIGLPFRSEQHLNYDYEYVIVSGWGYDSDDADGLTPKLHFTHLRVIPIEVCRHFFSGRIRDTHICTDAGMGQGVCHGDSGAPIVYRRKDGSSILLGMVSFISQIGCTSGWPNVFTRLDRYLDWISAMTNLTISG